MDISGSPPNTNPPLPGDKNVNGNKPTQQVTATDGALPQIPGPDPQNKPANKPLQQRTASAADNSQNLPTVANNGPNSPAPVGGSDNSTAPVDGQILIEAGDDPEAAAKQAVDKVEEQHGKEAAGKAKKFFGAVLAFCKAHKNEVMGIAGFCMMTGAVVGGAVFPGAFLLVAPGMMLFAASTAGDFSPALPPPQDAASSQPPGAGSANKPEDKNKKPEDEDPDKNPNKAAPPPAGNPAAEPPKPAAADPANLADPVKPAGGTPPKEDEDKDKPLIDLFGSNGIPAQPVPIQPTETPYTAMLNHLNLNNPVNSKLKEEDLVVFNKEDKIAALAATGEFTDLEIAAISAKYSKIAVGLEFFEKDQVRDNGKYPEVNEISLQEKSVLKQAYQRAAFEEAVDAVRQEKNDKQKRIPVSEIALKATGRVEELLGRLTPPESQQRAANFENEIHQFLTDFAESLDPKAVQARRDESLQ